MAEEGGRGTEETSANLSTDHTGEEVAGGQKAIAKERRISVADVGRGGAGLRRERGGCG